MIKKIIITTLILSLNLAPATAFDLDVSINEDIQKKFNSNKLNEDLQQVSTPSEIIKIKNSTPAQFTKSNFVPNITPEFDTDTLKITADNSKLYKNALKIPKHTVFRTKSNQKISDWNNINSFVSFTTVAPVYKKSLSIPTGAIFKGTIKNIHHPQVTGNGALVEIQITSMTTNGKTIPVNGKITKANSELIFFNKIKGNRQYLNGVSKKIKSANNFYSKSRNLSNKLSKNPISALISPLPTATGFVGSTIGTITSPITGLLEKGKNISYPAGTSFEIKLIDDAFLY